MRTSLTCIGFYLFLLSSGRNQFLSETVHDEARLHSRVSLAWIRKEDYLALSSLYEDGYISEESWEEWQKRAKNVEAGLRARGYIVERKYIDPKTFVEWRRRKDARLGRFDRMASALAGGYKH